MKLPKSFITVTPLSKTIALVLFIIFPICAFFYGRYYQQLIDKGNQPKIIVEYKYQKPISSPSQTTKSTTSCQSNFDCPAGYYCTRIGPIVYDSITKKTSGLTCQKKLRNTSLDNNLTK